MKKCGNSRGIGYKRDRVNGEVVTQRISSEIVERFYQISVEKWLQRPFGGTGHQGRDIYGNEAGDLQYR